jgi:predicted dehydrogenase
MAAIRKQKFTHTIGVALIGMGKCPTLGRDMPVVRRVMLCEVDEDLGRRRAGEFGLDTATADWRAVIAEPEVDVVSIAAPKPCTRRWQLRLSKRASEKSMAPALSDAERIVTAARAAGRVAIVGHNYIQSPAVRFIAKFSRAARSALHELTLTRRSRRAAP